MQWSGMGESKEPETWFEFEVLWDRALASRARERIGLGPSLLLLWADSFHKKVC